MIRVMTLRGLSKSTHDAYLASIGQRVADFDNIAPSKLTAWDIESRVLRAITDGLKPRTTNARGGALVSGLGKG